MSRSLHKSINSIKQKVVEYDEIMNIITLFIIQWPKFFLSFNGVNLY